MPHSTEEWLGGAWWGGCWEEGACGLGGERVAYSKLKSWKLSEWSPWQQSPRSWNNTFLFLFFFNGRIRTSFHPKIIRKLAVRRLLFYRVWYCTDRIIHSLLWLDCTAVSRCQDAWALLTNNEIHLKPFNKQLFFRKWQLMFIISYNCLINGV